MPNMLGESAKIVMQTKGDVVRERIIGGHVGETRRVAFQPDPLRLHFVSEGRVGDGPRDRLIHVRCGRIRQEDRACLGAQFDDVPGAELSFPHIYGPLNPDAVVEVTPLTKDAAGVWELPTLPAST